MQLHFHSITEKIITSAFEVSNVLGTGFLEKVYQNALSHELALQGLHVELEKPMEVVYKGRGVGIYAADMVVNGLVLVETKCVEGLNLQHINQVKNYLRAANLRVGMLINFQHEKADIKRIFV